MSEEVKRYSPNVLGEMHRSARGEYVLASDYDAAIARAELAEKLLLEIRAHNTKSVRDRIDAAMNAEKDSKND